jgi:hypothetical protein
MGDPTGVKRPSGQSGLAHRRSALIRHRPHQAVDLVLGVLLLGGIAIGVASLSPILALLVVVAATSGYLIGLLRQERTQRALATAPSPSASRGCDAIDALDGVIAAAPAIPLTSWVRVDPGEVGPLVEMIREAATAPASALQAEKLAAVVLGGRPVPLNSQVRVDRGRARRLLAGLRSSID